MRPAQGGGSDSESEPNHPHDEDEDKDNLVYTAMQPGHGLAFRSRILPRHSKGITTAPGKLGAGETETEADEPVRIGYYYFLIEIFNSVTSQNIYRQHVSCQFLVR